MVDDVSILTVSPLVQELNTVHPNYDIGKRCRNQSLGSSINAKKRQEIARKCWNLTRPVQRIGYQRNLQANQRASARLRGNINDPSQGAHSFAHAHQPQATGLETEFVESPAVILHRGRHSIPFMAYGHGHAAGIRMF